MKADVIALLEQSLKFERARTNKSKLVAKLTAGKLNKKLIPERIQKEIKRRAK